MSIATKPSIQQPQHARRRIWRVPISRAWWLWLLPCILFYAGIYAWYLYAIKTQPFPGPFSDPLRLFGIIAFSMVLATTAYSLRRRFVRSLPGKAQDWLWMHIWVGITAVLIALLHENYSHILHDYCQNLRCFTQADAGTSALFALIFLVASGVTGRLLDVWQTHIISQDASTNGVGIAQAIEARILELEYTIERLCAGKSEPFKTYCMQALERGGIIPTGVPPLVGKEHNDFQSARDTLMIYALLTQSLQRQKRARVIIRTWRSIHIVLASLALLVILFHGITELLTNVLHIL
jgi:predicted ferric reductase